MSEMAALKCIIVGDACVGKTCLLKRFIHNNVPVKAETKPTVVMETCCSAQVSIDGKKAMLNLWDTSGQHFDPALRNLYPGTDIFILCFSLSDPVSLEHVRSVWAPGIRSYCPSAVLILVGTKLDLRSDVKEQLRLKNSDVPAKCDGAELRQEVKAAKYIECSATSNENVEKVFEEAVRSFLLDKREVGCKGKTEPCSMC